MTEGQKNSSGLIDRWLTSLGIEPRSFRALALAMIWMDLRSQHYASATATKPNYAVSPFFWVIGQCLAISAISCLVLWLRVSLYMYVFTSIAISMVVLISSVLVEFNEIVFNPQDLAVIGPRPVAPRTYSAARFFNLLVYVVGLIVSLHIFPLVLGAAADDSGPWFIPAYLVAAISSGLISVCLTILLLSAVGRSESLEQWKAMLAWTQIVLFAICAYGAQLMFRRHTHAVEVWMAFPPDWVHWLPPAWFAKSVDLLCSAPSLALAGSMFAMLLVSLALCFVTIGRLAALYRDMEPLPVATRQRIMSPERVGRLPGLSLPVSNGGRETRIGFWICTHALRQDAALRMRCLYPLNVSIALLLVGLLSGQFGNPTLIRDTSQVLLPILSVYLTAAAIPAVLLNLTFSDDHQCAWLLKSAPLPNPSGVAVGAANAVQLWVITPLTFLVGLMMSVKWEDPVSGVCHAMLMWGLCYVCSMAALLFVVPDLPLSQPAARGGSLGNAVVPLAGFTFAASFLAGLHLLFARHPAFWGVCAVACLVLTILSRRLAQRRLNNIIEQGVGA